MYPFEFYLPALHMSAMSHDAATNHGARPSPAPALDPSPGGGDRGWAVL